MTSLREVYACGFYVLTYYGTIEYFNNDLSSIATFFLGGFAGVVSWALSYPLDVIKTVIQSNYKEQLSIKSAFYRVIGPASEYKNLFNGINATLGRAFLVNAIIFYTNDSFRNLLL